MHCKRQFGLNPTFFSSIYARLLLVFVLLVVLFGSDICLVISRLYSLREGKLQ